MDTFSQVSIMIKIGEEFYEESESEKKNFFNDVLLDGSALF